MAWTQGVLSSSMKRNSWLVFRAKVTSTLLIVKNLTPCRVSRYRQMLASKIFAFNCFHFSTRFCFRLPLCLARPNCCSQTCEDFKHSRFHPGNSKQPHTIITRWRSSLVWSLVTNLKASICSCLSSMEATQPSGGFSSVQTSCRRLSSLDKTD